MLLIFSENTSSRLDYTLDLIFGKLLGLDWKLTSDYSEFKDSELPKISYSKDENSSYLVKSELLFQSSIEAQNLNTGKYGSVPVLFSNDDQEAILPFDLFASVFWLVSRYEEYLSDDKDQHGRFPAASAWMVKEDVIEKPLVNIWVKFLEYKLIALYPDLVVKAPEYNFQPTFDIDNAWAYRNKPIARQFGGLLKAVGKLQFKQFFERLGVLIGAKDDPYDTYDLINEIHQGVEKPVFFWLLGDYKKNDTNLPASNKQQQKLIRKLAENHEIGIHPSYNSFGNTDQIKEEIARLASITSKDVFVSRQHFLRMRLPDTYRSLIEAGIMKDYTLGFAEKAGFRAGICTPFPFFDLETDRATDLEIVPLTYMEGSLRDYMNLDAEEALQKILDLHLTVRSVGGTFVSLWHNESFSEEGRWEHWSDIYRSSLNFLSEK